MFLFLLLIVLVLIAFGALSPAMVRKPLRHDRNRRQIDPSNKPNATPIIATVSTTGASNVTVDFDQPVSVKGLFGITVNGAPCTGQVVVSATQITLVAAAAVAGHDWVIGVNDPAIRNKIGGYVASASGTF